MTLADFNNAQEGEAMALLRQCCGASAWARGMARARPFATVGEVKQTAGDLWGACGKTDYLEAFGQHPKIGDLESLKKKYAATKAWASQEQSGVGAAATDTMAALAKGNRDYEAKFGYIFIVCATGKTAAEMLGLLQQRLTHGPDQELAIAAAEQLKITLIRIDKMLS